MFSEPCPRTARLPLTVHANGLAGEAMLQASYLVQRRRPDGRLVLSPRRMHAIRDLIPGLEASVRDLCLHSRDMLPQGDDAKRAAAATAQWMSIETCLEYVGGHMTRIAKCLDHHGCRELGFKFRGNVLRGPPEEA